MLHLLYNTTDKLEAVLAPKALALGYFSLEVFLCVTLSVVHPEMPKHGINIEC